MLDIDQVKRRGVEDEDGIDKEVELRTTISSTSKSKTDGVDVDVEIQ